MQIDKISTGLDWLHARLPKVAWRLFLIAAALLAIGLVHFAAWTFSDGYREIALAQYARAETERSIMALPLGHLLGSLGVVMLWLWVPTILVRVVLGLRARLWHRVGQ